MRAALLLALLAAPAAALDWTPIGGVRALGGFHSFNGDRGSLSGNVDATVAPAARLDESWSLLPSARASYEGARRVVDVLGTGTPAQERLELKTGLRAVWADPSSRWRLKPGLSYKATFLRETKDESWGKGLFDERLLTVGAEAELMTVDPHSVRGSLDYFRSSSPNYTTLESQAALQFQGRALARELVGDRALDRDGFRLGLAGDVPAGERLRLDGSFSTVWSRYGSQKVVGDDGQFTSDGREDFLTRVEASARMPREWNADLRALASLTVGAGFMSSNQNGYDAARGMFLPRNYDWRELSVTPSVRALIGPARAVSTVDLAVGWRRRTYSRRPPQDGTGVYQGGSLSTTEWTVSATGTYPVAPRFSVVMTVERASSSSNTRFERFYRYSYEALSVLGGVRWDF